MVLELNLLGEIKVEFGFARHDPHVGGWGFQTPPPFELYETMHCEIRIKLDVHGKSILKNLHVLFQKMYDIFQKLCFQNLCAFLQQFMKFDDYLKLELV